MTDKELKQLEEETVIMLKHNIEKMRQAKNLHDVYSRAEVVKKHTDNLRDYIVSRIFKQDHCAGKTGEFYR